MLRTGSSEGAGNEWDILNPERMSLYQEGEEEHARIVAKKALEILEKNYGVNHPDAAALAIRAAEIRAIKK